MSDTVFLEWILAEDGSILHIVMGVQEKPVCWCGYQSRRDSTSRISIFPRCEVNPARPNEICQKCVKVYKDFEKLKEVVEI